MKWFRRARRWLRRKRREYKGNAILREFVYLDEISVYSLLASRSGPVATEFTNTESDSLKGELGTGLTLQGGLAKGEVKSRVENTQTIGSQVVRKSSAQARFKQLLDDEQDEIALRAEPRIKQPSARNLTAVIKLGANEKYRDWVLDATTLVRGQLVECEVELAAEEIYRVSQTMTALLDIFNEDPKLFGISDRDSLREGITITRVLEQLLVGLVPIRARAVAHSIIRNSDVELIVRNELLVDLEADDLKRFQIEPLYIVGVTETELFWKDIRRILFSGNRYLTLCRLGHGGLQDDWTPIKLVDVLKDVSPELADQLDSTGRGLLSAMRASQTDDDRPTRYEQINEALVAYAAELAPGPDITPTRADLQNAELLLDAATPFVDTAEGRRELLAPVKTWVEQQTGASISTRSPPAPAAKPSTRRSTSSPLVRQPRS